MYLRNCGVKGCHKIQDHWHSDVYQVIKAPKGGDIVYTVAPVNDLGKIRHVHRTMLKAQMQPESRDISQGNSPPAAELCQEDVSQEDVNDDLFLVYTSIDCPVTSSNLPVTTESSVPPVVNSEVNHYPG